jgi:integrase
MPQMKLTKTNIDRVAKPDLFASDVLYWDTEIKGFGLRVTPTGKTTFIAQGRVNGIGAAVRVTVGPYGVFAPDQAREAAKEHLRNMARGTDPREVRRQDEAMKVTLRDVADAYFARLGKLKEATRNEMDRHVKSVFGAWENKPIASITEADVRKRHREMCETGLRGKPAPGQAQISLVTLRTLINFANRRYKRGDGTPLIPNNPVNALRDDFIEFKPRTRDVDERKVGEVYHMLAEARVSARDDDARAGVDLVRFLMLTGARRNEGAMLTWDRVNLDEGWFHLPDPKNRNPVWIPLSSQAVELLKSLPRRKLEDGTENPFCFPSRSKAGHVMDTRAPLERISKIAGLHLSAHDLRRTWVSVGVATLDIGLHKIELLTNHVPKGITAKHYLKTSRLQYLQREVQAIGDWIEQQAAIAKSKANGGNVVTLPQRA